jgi:hypothetical protein
MNKTGIDCPKCGVRTDESPCWNCGYDFDGVPTYVFKNDVSLNALRAMEEAELLCGDVKRIDNLVLKQDKVTIPNTGGYFFLRGDKICYSQRG